MFSSTKLKYLAKLKKKLPLVMAMRTINEYLRKVTYWHIDFNIKLNGLLTIQSTMNIIWIYTISGKRVGIHSLWKEVSSLVMH